MNATATEPEPGVELDLFGQRLVPVFTQISSCFAVPDDCDVDNIASILNRGSARLAEHFPWLAGQVVCDGATENNTGIFKIKPLGATPRVWIKDHRDDPTFPSWDELQRSHFPMNALDEAIFAPRKTIQQPTEPIAEVFQLQATLTKGGVILTFLGHHQAMDGAGQAQVASLFSKACRNEPFTSEELRIGNLAPENFVKVYGESWTPGLELEYNIIKTDESQPGPGRAQEAITPKLGVWSYFNFPASALSDLKSIATQSLPPDSRYITTDDALSAYIWQSIAKARLPRFNNDDDKSTPMTFSRAIDLRRYLDISETHPGFVMNMTYHSLSIEEAAISTSLGVIAADLRTAVDPRTTKLQHHGRSLATLISRTEDKSTISFLAGYDPERDVMLSSWANQNAYQLDFGLGLGTPLAVRRPRFDSLPGLVYLLPKTLKGGVGVAICLSEGDTDALMADGDFTTRASCVG